MFWGCCTHTSLVYDAWEEKKTWRKFSRWLMKADSPLPRATACWGPLSRGVSLSPHWSPGPYTAPRKRLHAGGNLHSSHQGLSRATTMCTLPSSGRIENYLALLMLWRSLCVSSERSEGTRISTGLILRTRLSSSERDGPSGKQSRNTSPVLGWTA